MTFELKDFIRIEKVGEGTYGVVYKCRNKITDELVAIKKIRSDNDEDGISSTTLREISILKELHHPNIVCLNQTMMERGKLYMVFEFLSMDLRRYLDTEENSIKEPVFKRYAYQILQGLLYCHIRRIIHRDLKPQNLLIDIDNKVIKIADFGLARMYGAPVKQLTHEVVTLWYRAPEILLGASRYSCPIDVWSVACIFSEMVTGRPLFQGDSEIDQLFSIFKIVGTPNESIWPNLSELTGWNPSFPLWRYKLKNHLRQVMDESCLDLMDKMLIYYPAERITVRDALYHPYFADVEKSDMPAVDEEKRSFPEEMYRFYQMALQNNRELADKAKMVK